MRSLVQGSPPDCGASECDREASIIFFNLLAIRINTFHGLIWWWRTNIISLSSGRIRAPPAKRPFLLHLRSIGKRLFSLRLFCFSRSGCRSALGCISKRSWCLVLLSCGTSLMNGVPRSLWSVEFDTYRGASAIDRSILDWRLCRVAILELLASIMRKPCPANGCLFLARQPPSGPWPPHSRGF